MVYFSSRSSSRALSLDLIHCLQQLLHCMALQPTLDGFAVGVLVLERIGAYLPIQCLSCFRNVNSVNRHALHPAVVNALARGGCEGINVTPRIVARGDAGAIKAVSARLKDESASVREAAVNVLAQIAEKGNAGVITAVFARLDDAQWQVRQAAVNALVQIADRGHADAIAKLSSRLVDKRGNLRGAAVKALKQIAGRGNAVAIRVERFDRRGTEPFEPFEPFEFFQNRNFH